MKLRALSAHQLWSVVGRLHRLTVIMSNLSIFLIANKNINLLVRAMLWLGQSIYDIYCELQYQPLISLYLSSFDLWFVSSNEWQTVTLLTHEVINCGKEHTVETLKKTYLLSDK
jgi:hypothetical protein